MTEDKKNCTDCGYLISIGISEKDKELEKICEFIDGCDHSKLCRFKYDLNKCPVYPLYQKYPDVYAKKLKDKEE